MPLAHRRAPLSRTEIAKLRLVKKPRRIATYIDLMLFTGLRVAEAQAIQPRDYDAAVGRLRVIGKGKKLRVVLIPPQFRKRFEAHLRSLTKTPAPTTRTIERYVKKAGHDAGIQSECCPHVLRHTFAVCALQAGISLAALQRLLGHSYLATTAIYLNLSPDAVLAEYEAKFQPSRAMRA